MFSFKEFYLQERLKSKHLIPPTDVEKTTNTHVSTTDKYSTTSYDDVYTRKTWRDKEERLHRDGGPAMILTDNEWSLELDPDDIIREYPKIHHIEAWYTHGMLNRQDGPAKTVIKNGKIESQDWFKNDKLHRVDGPAHIYNSQGSGKFTIEDFYIEGELKYKKQTSILMGRRTNIQYYDTENKLHREDDKPAYIILPDGLPKIKESRWYKHGQRHRLTGPAVIINNYGIPDASGLGTPDTKEYYINDKQILPGEFKQLTKQYNTKDIEMYNDLTGL